MDHTVYERKNTDLGSTSMTKSGGFSIKKRHRKLGALIGLAALAVPFAANLGTLGDAIHAVTGPQNVYESKLLNVKLETSQDKAKTTWDLEFDRSDMSVSEQTVKFKLDLEKAGLTDAEIAVKDGDKLGEPLDMREGIVDAVLKTQSTHLILTAISSNEDKHDITLPVTELGLYNEENGENLLPADNRSVDLTMAFEQVAEIAESVKEEAASSSETLTEAVAKEEESKSEAKDASSEKVVKEEKKAEKAPRVVDSDAGFVTGSDPAAATYTQIGGTNVKSVVMKSQQFTTPKTSDNISTDTNNFQIWSNKTYTKQVQTPTTQGVPHDDNANIEIRQKLGLSSAKIDSTETDGEINHITNVRKHFHSQYEQVGNQANHSSYLIEFKNAAAMSGAEFTVVYDNVGVYVGADNKEHQMGATLHISNIVAVDDKAQDNRSVWDGTHHLIDVPNNLYSGLLYQGILTLDVTVQFFSVEGGKFTNIINIENDQTDVDKASLTFDSLNNFGASGTSVTDQWDVEAWGLNTSTFAESAARVQSDGSLKWDAKTAKKGTAMTQDDNGKWYSTTHGHYASLTDNPSMALYSQDTHMRWVDIAESNTFERGAISYPITGTANKFRLFSGTGNTWQTLTSAQINPVALPQPYKTVTNASTYDSARQELQAKLDGTTEQYGAYDGESVSQAPVVEYKNEQYFVHDYWIFQPTYTIGDQSIAKSNKITMTDTLPYGMTLRNYNLSNTPVVFDGTNDPTAYGDLNVSVPGVTDRVTLSIGTDYTLRIENVTVNNQVRQKITVNFTDSGLGKTQFNSQDIAFELRVKVNVMAAIESTPPTTVVWNNQANVETGVSDEDTNWVSTHLGPIDSQLALRIHKVDDSGRSLSGASFTLKRTKVFEKWDDAATVTVDDVAHSGTFDNANGTVDDNTTLARTDDGSDGSVWMWAQNNSGQVLKPGVYTLTEDVAPGGYTGIDPITFEVNYTRHYVGLQPGDENYDVMQMVVTLADGTQGVNSLDVANNGGVELDVTNTHKPAQVKIKKQDADGNPLNNAKFEYRRTLSGTTPGAWKQFAANADTHTMGTDLLDFYRASMPVVYEVRETESSGYALMSNMYFKVIPKADFGQYSTVDTEHTPTTDIGVMLTNSTGEANYGWADMDTEEVTINDEKVDVLVGTFNVKNNPKSIFPRVGGTGIQAYIGAGLIVMLIAGGAAWYIKRRQNQ